MFALKLSFFTAKKYVERNTYTVNRKTLKCRMSSVNYMHGMLGNVNEVIFEDSDWSQSMRCHGNSQSEIPIKQVLMNNYFYD